MKIIDVVTSCGKTGFFFDDQKAIKKHAKADGNFYIGEPITAGFNHVRQAGESLSIQLILEDGQIALGDCVAVQYSGCGGRDPLFIAKDFEPIVHQHIKELLLNEELDSFKRLAEKYDHLHIDGKRIHTALRYGLTQALLDAVAKAQHLQMAELVAKEYGTDVSTEMIPIFSQSGDARYDNADKMILKETSVLPHGLFNHVEDKVGFKGEKLLAYVQWLRNRIDTHKQNPEYQPAIHLDLYGTMGLIFEEDFEAMVEYFKTLREASGPYRLRLEGPVDYDDQEKTMNGLSILTRLIDEAELDVQIVADEWCNTLEDIKRFADERAGHMIQIKTPDLGGIQNVIEAVLYCKEKGVGAYQGGSCNESDVSAKACVHCAMATQPCQILAKPGMGVDEGFMLAFNEMQRILAVQNAKQRRRHGVH